MDKVLLLLLLPFIVYHAEIKWELLLSQEDSEALEKEMAEFPPVEEFDEVEVIFRQAAARAAAAIASTEDPQNGPEEYTKDASQVRLQLMLTDTLLL